LGIETEAAYTMAKRMAREEGLLLGVSAVAALVDALQVAQDATAGSVIVTIFPDSGDKYLNEHFWTRTGREEANHDGTEDSRRTTRPITPSRRTDLSYECCGALVGDFDNAGGKAVKAVFHAATLAPIHRRIAITSTIGAGAHSTRSDAGWPRHCGFLSFAS